MNFSKQVMFLGIQESKFSDGKVCYGVSFYEPGGVPVVVNVVRTDNNTSMVDYILTLQTGDMVTVKFVLRSADKLYKLGIADVT